MRNAVRIFSFIVLCGALILVTELQAQESRYLQPTASLHGNTGLWKVLSPDTLPPGQAAFSVWYDRIGRNPGWLTISTIGVGGSAGLTDWLEFGASFDINRRVLVRRANQLSFGQQQLGFFGNKTPGSAPLASELMPGRQIPQLRFPPAPTGALTGAAGYYNDLPFASKIQGNGIGPVTVGLKVNIFSESKGRPLGFGVRGYAVIPTRRSMTTLLSEPTQTGAWQQGVDLIVSKGIKDVAELYWNAGFRNVQSPGDAVTKGLGGLVRLSDSVPLSFGLTIPRDGRFQFVEEINADLFVGSRTPNTSFGAEDPVDMTLGFRAFLSRYINLSAGYRLPLSQFGGDKNGFVVNLGYNFGPPYAEPVPPPPTLTCTAEPAEVLAGETVRLSAEGTSATGATLTYLWVTNGGTIEGSGPAVQLRTTNLGPGTYMATVRASEPPSVSADCTVRVRILAPPPPPTPPPPTVTCSAERTRVRVGEIVTLTARAQSPANRPLTYQWVSNGGRIEGTGATVRFDTTNLHAGTYTVQVNVMDDANQSAYCSIEITVEVPPPPPPPQPVKLDQCSFGQNSARVDNVCKAILDNVALRLQSAPEATLSIFGYAETAERSAQRLARSRAENARTYLVRDKGMAQSRVAIGTGTLGRGAESRRVELHLIPRGATAAAQNTWPGVKEGDRRAAMPFAGPGGPVLGEKAPTRGAFPAVGLREDARRLSPEKSYMDRRIVARAR